MRLWGWQDAGERFQVVEEKQKWNAEAFHWQDIRFVHSRRRYCRKTVPTIIMGEMKKVSRNMRCDCTEEGRRGWRRGQMFGVG